MASHFTDRALGMQMPASRKLLLASIADSASWETRISAPGADRMMAWSGVGKSQYQDLLTELVDEHLVVRHRPGVRGRKAEYIVFPHGCCLEHGPLEGYGPMPAKPGVNATGQPVALTPVVEPANATGQPGALAVMGPVMGPVMQPVQTGPLTSYLATTTTSESSSSHVSSASPSSPTHSVVQPQPDPAGDLFPHCGLCDPEGIAVVDIPTASSDGGTADVAHEVLCRHDEDLNRRHVEARLAARAAITRTTRPAQYGPDTPGAVSTRP